MNVSTGNALIDAATAFGASRILRNVHSSPKYDWERTYKEADDKLLFLEFLHALVFYDRIMMDCSCASPSIPTELFGIFDDINAKAGTQLLQTGCFAPNRAKEYTAVAEAACSLIIREAEEPEKKKLMMSSRIPWAYKSATHHDYNKLSQIAQRMELDPALVPFTLFSFRGLCYSGFVNHQANLLSIPTVYLASPGRMSALKKIVSARDLIRLDFARKAYADLVELLRLPAAGYDFSTISALETARVSNLALLVADEEPQEALRIALGIRDSSDAIAVRKLWAERIWAKSKSANVGAKYSGEQSMSNIVAGRDVIQIYCGNPMEE